MSSLVEDLQQSGAYPGSSGRVEFIETHISWVFLVGAEVYKVKKPVNLGFLDFLNDLSPLGDIVRQRLLAVNVLPGSGCEHTRDRVPVVGRADDHRIDTR